MKLKNGMKVINTNTLKVGYIDGHTSSVVQIQFEDGSSKMEMMINFNKYYIFK